MSGTLPSIALSLSDKKVKQAIKVQMKGTLCSSGGEGGVPQLLIVLFHAPVG